MTRKKKLFWGVTLDMAWKFYRKVVKIKSQKVLGTNFYVCRSYEEKLVGEPFCPRIPPHLLSWIGSMSVRETIQYQVFIRYCILFGSTCIITAYSKYTSILKKCIRRKAERNKKWRKAIKKKEKKKVITAATLKKGSVLSTWKRQ